MRVICWGNDPVQENKEKKVCVPIFVNRDEVENWQEAGEDSSSLDRFGFVLFLLQRSKEISRQDKNFLSQ